MDAMTPMLDPEQEHILHLQGGEMESGKLIDTHYYVALRIVVEGEDSPAADLRLVTDDDGEKEIEGEAPSALHVDRQLSADGPTYRPVRVFTVPDTGDYTLHNEGNSELWLVDDFANEMQVFSEPSVLVMFGSCCLGLIIGLVAIVFTILTLKNRDSKDGKQVSGIVIEGRVMTTDELYRAQQAGIEGSSESQGHETDRIPDPFTGSQDSQPERELNRTSGTSPEASDKDSDKWRSWDEG